MAKYIISSVGVAAVAKTLATPKVEPQNMTVQEIAARVKVYFNKPSKTVPVPTMMLGIGGRIVPLAFFMDGQTPTNRTADIPAGFEDSEENRADLARDYADAYLNSEEIQRQVRNFLVVRDARLKEEKAAKAQKDVATKVTKANLAVKAETRVAAEYFSEGL